MAFQKLLAELKARLRKARGRQSNTPPPQEKISAADRKLVTDLLAGLTAQVQHEQELVAARGKEPMSARLVPQVPVRERDHPKAWIGGGARLPSGMAWPEISGSALQLLAQIDCAQLPAELWGRLGPRRGWLAIFLDPKSLDAKVMHFFEAGDFKPSPPVLQDCNIVGCDGYKRAEASGYTWGFSRWLVDIVPVVQGDNDPRQEGRSQIRHERYGQRHDVVIEHRWPFDWSTMQMMMDTALAAYERAMPNGPRDFLKPEALAKSEQAITDAERGGAKAEELARMRVEYDERRAMAAVHEFALENGAAVVERLRALKDQVYSMATNQAFSAEAVAPILADMQAMTWMHKSVPPFYRDGQKLSDIQRLKEGVGVFALPLTTHDPSAAPTWVHDFETRLLDAAKPIYLHDPGVLPAALVADCEKVWSAEAAREIGGMGHVPWGYVHEFDDDTDVTLIELPSSYLVGWMFGDVYSLVITVKKDDLSRNDFSRPLVQITN